MTDTEPFVNSVIRFIVLFCKIVVAYIEAFLSLFRIPVKKSVEGKNILITGAGRGFGRELALKFHALGANLVIVDINEINCYEVKHELDKKPSGKNQKVLAHTIDIGDESQVANLAKRVKEELGDVDILINNAGIVQCRSFQDLQPRMVEKTFSVNILSHYWTLRHFLPAMLKNKKGHVVAVSSIAGLIGSKYLTDYCASKYAVVGLMDSLSKEIHENDSNPDIHFTVICPSSMSTGMFRHFTSRFNWLLPVLKPSEVASYTVNAILTNKPFLVIPPVALLFHRISSIIPTKVNTLVQDYLDYGVRPHGD